MFRKVKIVISCLEKESADLKVRLKYDNLGQSDFFRGLLNLYLENDLQMIKLVEKIKQENKTMSKAKIKKSSTEIAKGQSLLGDLSLTKSEIENLFDVLEGADFDE